MHPKYLSLYENGKLEKRAKAAEGLLMRCGLCPRKCGVNRLKDELGFCGIGKEALIYSFLPHFGEEPPISGKRGSGVIFFSGCSMACVYCQNYKFSQLKQGKRASSEELAAAMLKLQKSGCHNINLVTPGHVIPQVLKALLVAIPRGLRLPLVFNSSGYERPEIIAMLEGIVDIFLVDMRYADSNISSKYSGAADYPKYNRAAVLKMFELAGNARINRQGLMERGLIIRHLVLPNNIAGTEKILRFISREVSLQTHISLMSQYFACNKAGEFPELNRRISKQEYAQAINLLQIYGLEKGWIQKDRGSMLLAGTKIKPYDKP